MADQTPDDDKGQQPEALASLEAASRSGSQKPKGQGLQARADTAPEPQSLSEEQAEAAGVLNDNARQDTGRD